MKKWISKKLVLANSYINDLMTSERGDTNFISILIILGIVILVAGVFIGFKDTIVNNVTQIVNGFTIK